MADELTVHDESFDFPLSREQLERLADLDVPAAKYAKAILTSPNITVESEHPDSSPQPATAD